MIKFVFVAFALSVVYPSISIAKSNYFVRDYLFGMTLPAGEIEISADYLVMNDAVDILDFKESRTSFVSESYQSEALGDYSGFKFIGNYGISDSMMLSAQYEYRDIDITFGNYLINNFELSVTNRFKIEKNSSIGMIDYLFLAGGGKINQAVDYHASDIKEINHFVQKIDSGVSVYSTPGRINISNGTTTYSSSIVDENGEFKDLLTISIKDSSDYTFFVRGGFGKQFDFFHASFFTEIGKSEIKSRLDNNFALYGISDEISQVAGFIKSLDRSETYAKFGTNIYYRSNLGFTLNVSYYYITIDRDSNLDYVNYNHVVEANASVWITDNLAFNVGAEYFNRQFAGVVPLLYNEHSQTAFDHDYGVVNFGIMYKI